MDIWKMIQSRHYVTIKPWSLLKKTLIYKKDNISIVIDQLNHIFEWQMINQY